MQLEDQINAIINSNPTRNNSSAEIPLADQLQSIYNSSPAQQSQPTSSDPWTNFQQTAQQEVSKRGLPNTILPVLLSQAAIESARGQSAPGNNYFGIKGSGNAGSNNMATQEYGNGGYYGENDNFGAYNTPADSINSYLDLIMSYKGVPEAIKSGNSDAIIRVIEANGYATSPTYVQDVENTPEFNNNLPRIGGSYGSN